ncbi:cytochrome b/b6 domain-containing protein [Thiolapillus sp.]
MSEQHPSTIPVWDPLVRIFHWSLVLFFSIAYITEDNFLTVHVWAGYTVALLLAFRLVWGVVGTRYARFSSFITSPKTVVEYMRSMLHFRVAHYLGHNPAAGAMVIALLLSLITVVFSGMSIIAADGQGPLAGTWAARLDAKWMEEIHEFLANLTLLLVFLHVGGVVFSSFLENQNLPRAMLTGKKKYRNDYVDYIRDKK